MSTFFKTSARGIKGSISRFIAILSIVALGTGFLAGLLATTPDMKEKSNQYFADHHLYDYMIQCNLGVTDADRRVVEKMPEIDQAVALYEKDLFMIDERDDEKYETRLTLFQKGEDIELNKPQLEEGRLPVKSGEVFAVVPNAYVFDVDIGQVFKDEDGKEYKIVGKGGLPQYISIHGENTNIGSGKILLAFYGIDSKVRDVYTVIYATGKNLASDTFSDEYEQQATAVEADIKELGKERSNIRRQEIVKEAQETLDEKKQEYYDKKKEAEDKLRDAEQELLDASEKTSDGRKKLNQGIDKINAQIDELNAQQEKLDSMAPKIAQLEQAKKMAEQNGMSLPPEQEQALQQYYAGKEKLAIGKQKIEAARAEIERQKKEIERAEDQIRVGWDDYNRARKESNEKLAEAQEKIDDAQEEINSIKRAKWYVWLRNNNVGISAYESDVEKVGALAKIFPMFFFIVAILVALTTMTRMIEEERATIGTLKALGYSRGKIRSYYLMYGLLASLVGAVVGQLLGFYAFPMVISNAYSMMYNLPVITPAVLWQYAIPITVITVLGILATIFAATSSELKEVPASLLLPKAPPPGKRIFLEKIGFIWKRLKFSRKVTLRNLFRYKKRFLMTIIGIAGCYALLVAGFGIRDSIANITDLQFDEINTYDIMFKVKTSDWENGVEGLDKYTKVYQEQGKANSAKVNKRSEISIIVPKDVKEMRDFINLRDRDSGKHIDLDKDKVVIDEKLSEVLEVGVGDKINLIEEGLETDVEVGAICENYVGHIIYMTEDSHRTAFSKTPKYKNILANQNKEDDISEKEMLRRIKDDDNVEYVLAVSNIRKSFADSVKSINYIVLVLIIAAGALAIIVLYNLTNVNICERKKELATIKVLGFYDKETAGYIFREMHLLTAIGIAVGIPTGIGLHKYIIKTVEVGEVMFGRIIAWQSYGYSILLTILFAVIVNSIMKKVIKNIDMVESMKAND